MAINALELDILAQLFALGGTGQSGADLTLKRPTSAPQRRRALAKLHHQGLIEAQEAITQFGLTVTGKTLLQLDRSVWPVTPDELLILRSCIRGRLAPGQITPRIPVGERQRLLRGLVRQGLIVAYQTELVDLRLTAQGQQVLSLGNG
ncbi:MAG: hypothetical protein HC922_05305 [Leptolyngbyaceae cyanobacterium SM2_3_12]|nr:hypothetical protein [Leptolyngbyaceae cyanobacterium SM2_3_12]